MMTGHSTPNAILNGSADSRDSHGGELMMFCCTQCPFKCSQKVRLERHEAKHVVKSDHQCPRCTFSCRSEDILDQHMRLHANEPCSSNASTVSTPTLKAPPRQLPHMLPTPVKDHDYAAPTPQNMRINTPGSSKEQTPMGSEGGKSEAKKKEYKTQFKCKECPYISKHGCDLKAHITMHVGERPFKCTRCTYSTMRQNALKTHEELHDRAEGKPIIPSKEPAPVRLKEIKLKTIRSRQGRILGAHFKRGNERFYRCHYCPTEEKFCADLCLHSRNHFMKDASLQCEKCNFKTNLPKKMEEHKRAHPKDEGGKKNPGFKCTECPFQAKSYAKLWHHVQKHKKVSRFTCPRCSFSTGSLQCLNLHIVLHGEAPLVIKKVMHGQPNVDDQDRERSQELDSEVGSQKEFSQEPIETESSTVASEASSEIVEMEEDLPEASSVEKIEPEDEVEPLERKTNMENGTARNDKRVKIENGGSQDVSASETATPVVPIEYPEVEKMEEFVILKLDIPPLPPLLRPFQGDEDGSETSSSTVYRCSQCPFECSDEVVLKIHNEMHYGQRPFKCTMCSFNCFSAEALHTHLSLHAPPLSPISAMTMRKRMAAKRRNGALHSPEVIPPNVSDVLQCNQCSYKTMYQDRYVQHKMEHVQLLQQRLMTTIKRSTNDDNAVAPKIKRIPKKSDKMYNCTKCGFRSDTAAAYTRHQEFHGDAKAIFRCSICDYGANTHNIVLFHEQNHHLDMPLTYLSHTKHLNGYHEKETPVPSTHINQKLRCGRCDFRASEMRNFTTHWEASHCHTLKDREILEMLKLNMVPKSSLVDKRLI